MSLLIGVALFIFILILYENRHHIYHVYDLNRRAREVMDQIPGPDSIPILGSAYLFKWNVTKFSHQVEAWGRDMMLNNPKAHGLMKVWLGPYPLIICGTHESIKVVLDSNSLITKPSQYEILERWLGKGIVMRTGENWHGRRKLLTPAFHFSILRRYIPVFGEQGELLVSLMDEGADTDEVVDLFPLIKRCGLDIIAETAMGIRLGTQTHQNSDYNDAVYRLSELAWDYQRFPWLWIKPIWYATGYEAEFTKNERIAKDFTRKVIAQRREILEEEGLLDEHVSEDQVRHKKLALLDLLLMMQNANALTDEDLRAEVDTFMFEGSDTNSSNIGFTLWWLGQAPHEQERLHHELDEVFGASDRCPSEEDICRLQFLERCIKESLRLMAPVPLIARTMSHDVQIGDRTIPEGMTVLISPLSAHRDPKWWDRPEEYYPDHFLPEKQASRDAFTYIPFSAGPRNCIGQKFAMLEAKSILAQIFRKYRVVTLDCWPDNRPTPQIILKPSKGFRVKIYRRR